MIISFSSHVLFAQTNLVQNPSFENGLTSWLKGPTSSYTIPLVLEDGYNSSSSVGYTSPTGTTGFYQNVPVQPNKTYILSFWYKAIGDNTDARLWSFLKDDSGATVYLWNSATLDPLRSFNGYLPASTSWIEHRVEFTNTTATVLELAVRAYSGSQTAFDEFSLVDKSELGTTEYVKSKYTLVHNTIATNELLFATNAKDIQMYNSKGQLINKISVNVGDKLNVSNLQKGIYILNGEINGEKVTQKILIK